MKYGLVVYIIGFLAQAFFSARILFQWILSERAKTVLSPSIFWILSLAGSYLLCLYGWLRDDFSIVLGQFISYYIYLWNLNEKGVWRKMHVVARWVLGITPILAVAFVLHDFDRFIETFFKNENIPLWLIVFGSMGQIIFTFRFVYQVFYSYRNKESLLPSGFWILSLIGSSVIVSYGIVRSDPVLILGQSIGFIAYSRNLFLSHHHSNIAKDEK